MDLLGEIREYFASTHKGARAITNLSEKYPGIVIRMDDGFGVAIPFKSEKVVSEKFANSKIYTRVLSIEGKENKYLILSCNLDTLRYEFATICAQFVEAGDFGIDRKNLIDDPLNWWKQWKLIMGNSIYDKKPYSIISEMLALESLYKIDKSICWSSVELGSHDIEGDKISYEVKSTIKRYGATITIAGQHQLKRYKELLLYFCRLEKSKTGISINDMKERLVFEGYSCENLEMQLYQLGYEIGTSLRDEKYKVLEKRRYIVDDSFPKITKESFKDEKIPESVIQITYTIDLEGIEYTTW